MGEDFVKRMREKEQTQRMLVEAIDGLSAERKRVRMVFLKWASVFGLVAFAIYMVFDSLVPSLGPLWADMKTKVSDIFTTASAPPAKTLEDTAMTKLNQALTQDPAKAGAEAAAKAKAQAGAQGAPAGQPAPDPTQAQPQPTQAATTAQPPGTGETAPQAQPAQAQPQAQAQPAPLGTVPASPASAASPPAARGTAPQPQAVNAEPVPAATMPLPGVQAIPLQVTALKVQPVDLTRFHPADESQSRLTTQLFQWLQAPAGQAQAVPRTAYRDPASAGFRAPPPAALPPAPRAPQVVDYQPLPQPPAALLELEKNGHRSY